MMRRSTLGFSVESLPFESLPFESLPVESLPVESLPVESLSARSADLNVPPGFFWRLGITLVLKSRREVALRRLAVLVAGPHGSIKRDDPRRIVALQKSVNFVLPLVCGSAASCIGTRSESQHRSVGFDLWLFG